ncbi:hypothetical protein CEXT_793161 [Caerostris extrusa]|uniref:Uncharacterized protein n=1 Tax=Caerostris extrusa TaxID=172846 RepID=A0AAV4V5W4_CAEEX|nr:hypothetical protein CEXT_793161 [Caerostris extrusa]
MWILNKDNRNLCIRLVTVYPVLRQAPLTKSKCVFNGQLRTWEFKLIKRRLVVIMIDLELRCLFTVLNTMREKLIRRCCTLILPILGMR